MFWDKAAAFYDLFENVYNGKVYKGLARQVACYVSVNDKVLECACGTGMISRHIAPCCQNLTATDFSQGMLRQAEKNCRKFNNVTFRQANIMRLEFPDNSFDKVVAGNVIHLLDDPKGALKELERVCKPGGMIIVPTYVNIAKDGNVSWAARMLEKLGVSFKRQFTPESYKTYFESIGYIDTEFVLVEGRMPCDIAVIVKKPISFDAEGVQKQ